MSIEGERKFGDVQLYIKHIVRSNKFSSKFGYSNEFDIQQSYICISSYVYCQKCSATWVGTDREKENFDIWLMYSANQAIFDYIFDHIEIRLYVRHMKAIQTKFRHIGHVHMICLNFYL